MSASGRPFDDEDADVARCDTDSPLDQSPLPRAGPAWRRGCARLVARLAWALDADPAMGSKIGDGGGTRGRDSSRWRKEAWGGRLGELVGWWRRKLEVRA